MFTRWLDKKRSSKKGEKLGNLKVLERKTADIRDKLARLSLGSTFRRHSAPAQSSRSQEDEGDEGRHYGCKPQRRVADPAVLSQLPAPILEMILEHLSLKVRLRLPDSFEDLPRATSSQKVYFGKIFDLITIFARRVSVAC